MAHFLRSLTTGMFAAVAVIGSARAERMPAARQITFSVFCDQPVKTLAYEPQPGATPMTLAFYPTARSPAYTYRGPETLRFLDATTGEIVAETALPVGIHRALFILSVVEPARLDSLRYAVRVVDDDTTRQPPGTLVVLNLSGLELSGRVNLGHVRLREGINEPIPVGATAVIDLRTPFNGRTYQSYAETLRSGISGRVLLLLLPPYRRGSLEVQSRVLVDAPVREEAVPER